jgi:hypothetical protein
MNGVTSPMSFFDWIGCGLKVARSQRSAFQKVLRAFWAIYTLRSPGLFSFQRSAGCLDRLSGNPLIFCNYLCAY